MEYKFTVGQFVVKRSGYKYPCIVVAAFITTRDKPRYVVECTAPDCEGMLHIFNADQLAPKPQPEGKADEQ